MQNMNNSTPTTETTDRATAIESQEKYNGWANYETWCVNLWLSNDPHTDEQAREIVAHAWNNAADEIAADRDAIVSPRVDAADALKEWLQYEENPLTDRASMYADLLGAALDTVDWLEIAEAFQPDPLPSLEPTPEDDD